MRSQLALEIRPTADCSRLRIQDCSVYNPDIEVTCPQLLITLPGFIDPIYIDRITGGDFNMSLNAYDLKLQATSTSLVKLPDGLYNIHYSINPNEKLFVEYNHLRDCEVRREYFEKVCALELMGCDSELEAEDIKKNYKKLQEVDFYLKAAKAYVEQCNVPERGMNLFKHAIKLLKKINLKCNHC